jgi:hypothetical protein
MQYQCGKCHKLFPRKIDINRHMLRKTPCVKNLNCTRCFKIFTKVYDLNNHLNRKFPCENVKEEMELKIKYENIRTNNLDKELKIEHEKTQQEKIKLEERKLDNKTAKSSITNIAGDQININIEINNHFKDKLNIDEISCLHLIPEEINSTYALSQTHFLGNLLKLMYNNSDKDMLKYQSIVLHGKDFYTKLNDKAEKITYDRLKPHILANIDDTCNYTARRINPKKTHPPDAVVSDTTLEFYDTTPNFVSNVRNSGIVKKSIVESVKKIPN